MYVLKGGMKSTVMSGHKNDQCCRHHYCANNLIIHFIKNNEDNITKKTSLHKRISSSRQNNPKDHHFLHKLFCLPICPPCQLHCSLTLLTFSQEHRCIPVYTNTYSLTFINHIFTGYHVSCVFGSPDLIFCIRS